MSVRPAPPCLAPPTPEQPACRGRPAPRTPSHKYPNNTSINSLEHLHADLAAQIQDNVELVLQKAPAGARRGGSSPDEVAELRGRIDADQRLLVQARAQGGGGTCARGALRGGQG